MADQKRRFYAEPGIRVRFVAGPDARVCEYVFDDSGVLEFNADDQEPVAKLQEFVESESQPISDKAPERKTADFASREDRK